MNPLHKANLSAFLMNFVVALFLLGMAAVLMDNVLWLSIISLAIGSGMLIHGLLVLIRGGKHQRKIYKDEIDGRLFEQELNASDAVHFRGVIFLKSWLVVKGYYRVSIIRYEDIIKYYKTADYDGRMRVLLLMPLHYILIETEGWYYKAPFSKRKDGDMYVILGILAERIKGAKTAQTPGRCWLKEENESVFIAKTIMAVVLFVIAAVPAVIWVFNQSGLWLLWMGVTFFLFSVLCFARAFRHLGGDKDERAIKKDDKTRDKFGQEINSSDVLNFSSFMVLNSWLIIKDYFRTYIIRFDDITECYESAKEKTRYVVIKAKDDTHEMPHSYEKDGDISRVFEVLKERLKNTNAIVRYEEKKIRNDLSRPYTDGI
jgi:membrane protein implicated in regulation of membrane protease activity